MRLVDGSRVVIVGGGPAGSFTAVSILRLAAEARIDLEVILLEPRDFSRPGRGGCNMCAGILSSRLIQNLERLGMRLPPDVIQSELDSYILHVGDVQLPLHRPDPARRIFSIYRGGGPRLGAPPFPRSFDGWLLDQARAHGADVRRTRARMIREGTRPVVVSDHQEIEADLVVLATGVNSPAPLDPCWGYRPPRSLIMAQDELTPAGDPSNKVVHVFFEHPRGLIFGGMIPKGRYVNISLLGRELPRDPIREFLDDRRLRSILPADAVSLCGCAPRVAVSKARRYFSDRFVAVGDAAVTRLYKDGIGAAFLTAEAAARTSILRGVSRRDFAAGYQPVCRRIARDNYYGQLLFRLWEITRGSRVLRKAWMEAILKETTRPDRQRIHTRVLWGMFTGDETYRGIFRLSVSPVALSGIWHGALDAWRKR